MAHGNEEFFFSHKYKERADHLGTPMVVYLVRPYEKERVTSQHWQAYACLASDGRVWTAIGPSPDDALYYILSDVSFQTALEVAK